MNAVVKSVQVGRVQEFTDDSGKAWKSGILKAPVDGPVEVRLLNIVGDEQADQTHHGGADKAVLAYSADHFSSWELEHKDWGEHKGWGLCGGSFGENLTITGQTERDVLIGDIFQIGSCRLQVSQPRQPCWKLARRWNMPKLAVEVQKTGRTGWYYRVLEEGIIRAGDPIQFLDRVQNRWSVATAHQVMHAKPRNAIDDRELADCKSLSASWASDLLRRSQKVLPATDLPNSTSRS